MTFEQIMKAMDEEVLARLEDPEVDPDEPMEDIVEKYSAMLIDMSMRDKEEKK